ncbi:hypothetical protein VTO73DRAFT_11838 [Trametes versicolor]
MPQCKGCGCTYQFLATEFCGSCAEGQHVASSAALKSAAGVHAARSQAQDISERAGEFDKKASEHRLRQTRNSAETKNSLKATDLKNKQESLRDLRVAEFISVEVLGFYSLTAGASTHPISKNCTRIRSKTSDSTELLFDKAIKCVRDLYEQLPASSLKGLPLAMEDIAKSNAVFSIPKGNRGAAAGYHINVATASTQAIGDFFKRLQSDGQLTVTDIKDRLIRVNVCIYPPPEELSDDDVVVVSAPSASLRRSAAKRKRDRAGTLESQDQAPEAAGAKPKYVSAFRAPPEQLVSYESFSIRRTLCFVDNHGIQNIVAYDKEEEILVAKGWQKFKSGSEPLGGWLGGGGSKYAFAWRVASCCLVCRVMPSVARRVASRRAVFSGASRRVVPSSVARRVALCRLQSRTVSRCAVRVFSRVSRRAVFSRVSLSLQVRNVCNHLGCAHARAALVVPSRSCAVSGMFHRHSLMHGRSPVVVAVSRSRCLGIYNGETYALLQMGPLGKYPSTDTDNATHLLDELKLLALSQFFAKTFYERAIAYKVDLPNIARMRFNFEGAFIGQLVDSDLVGPIPFGLEQDNRTLLHDTFLATRLISKEDGYKETKFSGADKAGQNSTVLGRAIDAFAHHSLVDSNETCVLVDLQGFVKGKEVIMFDPQAHTYGWSTGRTGYWDHGKTHIDMFKKEHQCNTLCQSLGLAPPPKKKVPARAKKAKNPMAVTNLVQDDDEIDELESD